MAGTTGGRRPLGRFTWLPAALLAALNARRTGQMRDIVATIQAEQDKVIRSERNGVLVAQGSPGTGKTAVALHRAAYLLYTCREQLAARVVLVIGMPRLPPDAGTAEPFPLPVPGRWANPSG